MMKPSILIVSSSNTRPDSLIKLITKTKNCGDLKTSHHVSYPWVLDTKYYTAEVDFIGITKEYARNQEFNDNVEALIIHMDSNKTTGLEDLSQWSQIENDCEPEVKLLLANYCDNTTKVTKLQATEWCLKHGFELIELYPSLAPQKEVDNQEIFVETFGVDRVIEALHAHIWPNLLMKEEKSNEKKKSQHENQDSSPEDCDLDDGPLDDDFTELFAQLSVIKESFQGLPMNQRKQCAEQVVTAFWKAIGGDEDEIEDICSSVTDSDLQDVQ